MILVPILNWPVFLFAAKMMATSLVCAGYAALMTPYDARPISKYAWLKGAAIVIVSLAGIWIRL